MEQQINKKYNYENFLDFSDNTFIKTKDTEILYCPECNTDENDFEKSDGYIICMLCGIVIKNRISESAEWTNYPNSGNGSGSSRCGSIYKSTEINPYTNGLSSFVPKGVKNICYVDGKMIKYDISNIHVKNNFNHNHKSFLNVENQLDNVTSDKYPTRIVDTSKILWSEIDKYGKITRAGVRKGLIACCLYYSCIHYNCIRDPLEICKIFGMKNTEDFNKGDKEFKKIFENNEKWGHLITKTSNSTDYFNRFCCDLEINHILPENKGFFIAKECKQIYNKYSDELSGLYPKSIACGIILYILKKNNININKTKLCELLNICNPSLSKCYNIIVNIDSSE